MRYFVRGDIDGFFGLVHRQHPSSHAHPESVLKSLWSASGISQRSHPPGVGGLIPAFAAWALAILIKPCLTLGGKTLEQAIEPLKI